VDLAFIEKTAVSAVAVALMVALAAWARIARPTPALDEARVRGICAEEFPGLPVGQVWIAADGRGAIARSGEAALLIFRLGDGYVARSLAWSQALTAKTEAGRLTLRLDDIGAPRASFAVSDAAPWPPAAGAAA
jgi:hypothetical protein